MRTSNFLATLVGFALICSGCASLNAPPPTYPVSGSSTLEFVTHYTYWPELSGYYLPPGTYKPESADASGFFFKSPKGMKLLSLAGGTSVEGGIYLPKVGSSGVRGYVYIKMPFSGRPTVYILPSYFFSAYEKKWRIVQHE